MADAEVATKAPETDALENSAVPKDTPAQEGPTMGVRPAAVWEEFKADCDCRNTV